MYGGCVTDNNQTMNGCVRVSGSGVFAISGSARIKGGNNAFAYLEGDNPNPIQILDTLDTNWKIKIRMDKLGVFTSGLSGKGTAANFAGNAINILVGLNADGEAVLGERATVIFAPGDDSATGTMGNATVVSGSAYTLPECGYTVSGKLFAGWQIGEETKQPGGTVIVTADTTVTAVWEDIPVFGNADFILPAGTASIEPSAFEGIAATVVEIPANCTSIGDYAFRDCTGLTMIRIPAGCALGTDVFDGCGRVYVFSATGSPAEAYCQSHGNCVFVEEGQD